MGKYLMLLCTGFLFISHSFAQQEVPARDTVPSAEQQALALLGNQTEASRFSIAVFTPLYLDSAFDNMNNYRYGSDFPKFFNPGLEFYEGVLLAADSLSREGLLLDLHIYDTRATDKKLEEIIAAPDFLHTDLIIGHVNSNEARALATVAGKIEVPFINVNFPNDAGIRNNPNYVILNSTLLTHVKALYSYLQKHHALDPITVYTKKGPQEDMFKKYFQEIGASTRSVPLKLKYVTVTEPVRPEQLLSGLSADKRNVSVAASLDIQFGQKLAAALALVNEQYPISLFGMPTWDVIDFTGAEYKNLEIFISTPFYISPDDSLAVHTENSFKARYFSRPTDMVFRGYETVYHFANLLKKHGRNISSSLGDASSKIFTEFNLQPFLNPTTLSIDYYENKKIYFIRKIDGEIVSAH